MEDNERIKVARSLAERGHKGQVDKCGAPYFEHVERVALFGETPSEQIVGYLHDIVEDGHMTHEELSGVRFYGAYGEETVFTPEELEAIKLLDKTCGLDEEDKEMRDTLYYSRIKANELARRVKIADLRDNMDLDRFAKAGKAIGPKDIERLQRYQVRYNFLLNRSHEN